LKSDPYNDYKPQAASCKPSRKPPQVASRKRKLQAASRNRKPQAASRAASRKPQAASRKRLLPGNQTLSKAKKAKQDEFYQLAYRERTEHYKHSCWVIFCNCDII
jgi:hypothetical protein